LRRRNLFDDPEEVLTPHWDLGLMGAVLVSNSVMVLLRTGVGPRLLPIFWMGLTHCIMFGMGYLEASATHPTATMMLDGVGIALLGGLSSTAAGMHRWKGRPAATSADSYTHSRSRGRSILLIPGVEETSVQRWAEPLLIFVLGAWLVKHDFILLSWWLAVAGACLAAIEGAVSKEANHELMDLRDSRASAQALKTRDAEPSAQAKQEQTRRPAPRVKTAAPSPELSRLMRDKKNISSSSK